VILSQAAQHDSTGPRWCSYPVPMENDDGILRRMALSHMAPGDVIVVTCPACGRIVEIPHGYLQRRHGLPSTMLIYDRQFRFRCRHCNCRRGFRIVLCDGAGRGDRSAPRVERVIVEGDAG
jgi:hypothetical protein